MSPKSSEGAREPKSSEGARGLLRAVHLQAERDVQRNASRGAVQGDPAGAAAAVECARVVAGLWVASEDNLWVFLCSFDVCGLTVDEITAALDQASHKVAKAAASSGSDGPSTGGGTAALYLRIRI